MAIIEFPKTNTQAPPEPVELTAYLAYLEHLRGCLVCAPDEGLVCRRGHRLHDAWRRAAEADE